MVGAKNVISTMLQSFIAMGLISVLWVAIGFSLCFGEREIAEYEEHIREKELKS